MCLSVKDTQTGFIISFRDKAINRGKHGGMTAGEAGSIILIIHPFVHYSTNIFKHLQ